MPDNKKGKVKQIKKPGKNDLNQLDGKGAFDRYKTKKKGRK